MSKRYPGNFITGNPVALSQTSNNGVWDVKDVSAAVDAGTWQEPDGIYEIPKSLRFRNAGTTYLSRTPIAAGNRKTWTWSAWIKRSRLSAFSSLFACNNGAGSGDEIGFRDSNALQFATNGGTQTWLVTSQLFRDTAAWYHIVCTIDTTSASTRAKIYVNGVQVTALSTNTQPSLNAETTNFNTASTHLIGSGYTVFDGYMAEQHFIDGQALDASYFGYFDPITNIWQPKKYNGSYGTNGFYLPFNNTASTASLGWDYVQNPDHKFTFAQGSAMSFNSSTFKYGGSSMYFTGAAGGGTSFSGNSQYAIGTGQFCIEAWIYPETGHAGPAGNSFSTIISQGNNASNTLWALSLPDSTGANTTSRVQWGFTGATTISTATLTLNAWHHVMVCRDASNVERMFIDGVLVNQRTNTTNYNNVSAYNTNIGFMYDSNYPGAYGTSSYGNVMKGYINDLRLTIGAIPVPYQTSSVTIGTTIFTPPTSALPIGPQGIDDPRYWNNVAFHMPFNGSGTTAFPVYCKGAFTPVNTSLTAGVTYDSMVDSPTNVFTSATDVGGVVSGNYPVINPLTWRTVYSHTPPINGNLTCTSADNSRYFTSTIASSGSYYFEITATTVANNGISAYIWQEPDPQTGAVGALTYVSSTGGVGVLGAAAFTGATFTSGDVIGLAHNTSAGTVAIYKNNILQGTATGLPTTANLYPGCTVGLSSVANFNFGQRPFAYTPPAGFKSLNTTNIQALGTSVVSKAAIQPHKWMDVSVWGGTSLPQQINNGGFQPDLVWVKQRGAATDHVLYDTVRGVAASLSSNTMGVEVDRSSVGSTIGFNNSGFVAGADSAGYVNYSGRSYVGWQWKQSPTSGFNVVSYSGAATAQSITHNLGVPPAFIMVKNRDNSTTDPWIGYHKSLGKDKYMIWSSTDAVGTASNYWGSTEPNSSTFGVSAASNGRSGGRYIAYVWAEVPGFSKFGTYVGNGSTDGTFVHTGFKPKYIFVKTTSAAYNWWVWDSARDTYNYAFKPLIIDGASTEYDGTTFASLDIVSNGFKFTNAHQHTNYSGYNYIYAAFAESPFALNNRAR